MKHLKLAMVAIASFLSLFSTLGCESQDSKTYELQNPSHLLMDGLMAFSQSSERLFLGGEAIGFGRLPRDGKIDFALITPSLTRLDLLNFDLSTLISPEFDQINVVGQKLDIPSNLSLPRQAENYSIVSIRLDKPEFRSYVKTPGAYTFSALHGQFPVRKVIDDFRAGKSVFEILNHFTFIGGGQIEAQVNDSMNGQNISVDQFSFDQESSLTAPSLADGTMMFSLSLSEVDGNLSPVDIKRVAPNATENLKVSPLGNPFTLSAVVEENPDGGMPEFNRLSLTLLPNDALSTLSFLELTESPQLIENSLKLFPPTLHNGIEPVAIYISFSEIRKIDSGSVATEEKTVLWENWHDGFTSSLDIPEIDYEKNPNRSYRYEVLYLAKDSQVSLASDSLIDQVTHISRNILEVD